MNTVGGKKEGFIAQECLSPNQAFIRGWIMQQHGSRATFASMWRVCWRNIRPYISTCTNSRYLRNEKPGLIAPSRHGKEEGVQPLRRGVVPKYLRGAQRKQRMHHRHHLPPHSTFNCVVRGLWKSVGSARPKSRSWPRGSITRVCVWMACCLLLRSVI